MSHVDEIKSLMRQARVGGVAGVALAEEAARIADVHGEVKLAYDARREVVHHGIFGGQPERALVAFSWCLSRCDADPTAFPDSGLLWSYKWIAENLPLFAQFGRAQIAHTLDDMERRYKRAGASLRPVHLQRARAAMVLGDPDEAVLAALAAYRAAPRDGNADCAACERNFEVEVLLHVKQFEQAERVAQPLLDGRMGCAEVPHITNAILILPAWQAGEREQARRYAARAAELCQGRDFVREVAAVLDLRVLEEDWAQAADLLQRHLGWAVEALDTSRRLRYFLAAEAAVAGLARAQGDVLPLRFVVPPPVASSERGYEAAALGAWLGAQVDALTAQYVARDGNDEVARRTAAHRAMHRREA